MKLIVPFCTLFSVVVGVTTLYLRNPALDQATVHTERIGGSFAYKTMELLAYSPIVYSYNVPRLLPLTVNYQSPLSVFLTKPDVPVATIPVHTPVSVPGPGPDPHPVTNIDIPADEQSLSDVSAPDDTDDTVAIEVPTQ